MMRRLMFAAFWFVLGLTVLAAPQPSPSGLLVINESDLHVGQTMTVTAVVHNLPSGGGALSELYYGWVEVDCDQGAINVLDSYQYLPQPDTSYTLSFPLNWASGRAACTVSLFYDRTSRTYSYKPPHRTAGNTLVSVSVQVGS